ncbi:saccharopine dehydrogenase C-terminal domain-containing protein [Caldivirga sp.]|uniref:saccharopine dehydrogenase C-terminal domain-containing protein n=1 Tax=Caldivirga sp. TaxID=2080243 RepID=UPI0025C30AF2|nr:saccharopine dehydrogenase C-terminal domain-containing protein [Caldivirga sp.]
MGVVTVVGLGSMGKAALYYLLKHTNHEVWGYDKSSEVVNNALSLGANAVRADVMDDSVTKKIASNSDVVLTAVPQSIADSLVIKLHDYGVNVVDLIFLWKFSDEVAGRVKNGPLVIPACGWAPGLTNLLAVAASSELDIVEEVGIHVGGNPVNPRPPLYYDLLFSVESTIEEYVRPATIMFNGELKNVDPLSFIYPFKTWLIEGDFSEFYTDGLSTLIVTMPKWFRTIKTMYERTIRWSRHLEVMRVLKDLGLLNNTDVLVKSLGNVLKPGVEDFSLTIVEAKGMINGEPAKIAFEGIDYAREGFTSMARLTGFTAAIVADLVAKKAIVGSGLVPIEEAYVRNRDVLRQVLNGLKAENVKFMLTKTVTAP